MSLDGSTRELCVDKPRCRLCQFQIHDDQLVVAVVDHDVASAPFLFCQNGEHEDKDMALELHMCCSSRCMRMSRRVPCLHSECHSLKLPPVSADFLAATNYDFKPSQSYEFKRLRRVQFTLASRLKLTFLRQMPQEICCMVAKHVAREMATITWQDLTRDAHPSEYEVHLSGHVYATYVSVEGTMYLHSLQNTPSRDQAKGQMVHHARQGHVTRKVYVAYDHLGIRGVHFEFPNNHLSHSSPGCGGVWWTELSRDGGIVQVTAQSDGLKVRRLLDSTESTPAESHAPAGPSWPTPGLKCRLINLDTCAEAHKTPSGLRMSAIDCNAAEIVGYSAAIFGFDVSRIYSHRSGSGASTFDELDHVSQHMLWMYMPVDRDEYLEAIWAVRHPEYGFLGFMFCANHGRAMMFGSYLLHPEVRLEFHRVYAKTDGPSQIYVNEWDPFVDKKRIGYFGVDMTSAEHGAPKTPDEWEPYPPSLTPSSPPPYTQYNELWYYTNCRLEDVVEITCCTDKTAPHEPIIGMLLRYGSGRRACVGQYRIDWTADTSTVDVKGKMSIGLGKTRRNLPYVASINVQGQAASDLDSLRWMEMAWHGRLEWWFSQRQCKIRYSDSRVRQ